MRRVYWVTCTLAIAAACSCEDTPVDPVVPKISVQNLVDFGDVPVGLVVERKIEVQNSGPIAFTVTKILQGTNFTSVTHTFSVSPSTFVLAPNQSAELTVRFQAQALMQEAVESTFELETDALKDGAPLTARVVVRGRGVPALLIVTPNPADFGDVLAGSSRVLELTITNPLGVEVDVTTPVDANNRPAIQLQTGDGTFAIEATPEANGSLGTLGPGASMTVDARFTPDPAESGVENRARWQIASCPSPLCVTEVILIGSGTDAALDCQPPMIEFGAVNPERTARRTVRCRNIVSDTIAITSWALDANSAVQYSVDPFPTETPTVAPGASIEIVVSLTPTLLDWMNRAELEGTLVIRGENPETMDGISPARIPLHGSAGGPAIAVSPQNIDFGFVQIGTRDRRRILIENTGYDPLIVSAIEASDPAYRAGTTAFTLLTGSSTVVDVFFAPNAEALVAAELVIYSNDAIVPQAIVLLTGEGVELGPCSYLVMPASVGYGRVELGQSRIETVSIQNTGQGTCLINHLETQPTGATTSSRTFTLLNGPENNVRLMPGEIKGVPIEYRPERPGRHSGELEFYISDPNDSLVNIPLQGNGFGVTQIQCPPEATVEAGTPVTLDVIATSQTGTTATLDWQITSAPAGGIGTPGQWNPQPPNAVSEIFLAYLVGRYEIEVTLTDGLGITDSCTTAVTAYGHGLRVELIWDGFGDVDLHLHNNNMTPWFGAMGTIDDCFYANCNMMAQPQGPLWFPSDPPYEGRNPGLDFDNIVGFGPENTRVNRVLAGDTFHVALQYFWDHGWGARTSTVNIYCGEVASPTAVFVSRPMIGLDQGNCTDNDFWRVATVTFTSSSACNVTAIDTYQTGNEACLGF